MLKKDYDAIDKVFEQTIWVISENKHAGGGIQRKHISFDTNTGIIKIPGRDRFFKEYNVKNIVAYSSEELYDIYLQELIISKEKAYVNCRNSHIFDYHSLIKQTHWSKLSEIKDHLFINFPELLI